MKNKDLGVAIGAILILFFIVIVGSSLSAFIIAKNKVEVHSILVTTTNSDIKVTDEKDKDISALKIKSSAIGVRPATGDESIETEIPTTINDSVGTEGAYGCFKLTTTGGYRIILKGLSVTKGSAENLDNIKIAVMDDHDIAVCGADVNAEMCRSEAAVTNKEIVIVVWLDEATTKSIAGGQISAEISIEPI